MPTSNKKKAKSRRKLAMASSASHEQAAPPPVAPLSASATPPRDLAPGTAPDQDSPALIAPDTPPPPDPPTIARDDAPGDSSPAPITAAPSAVEVSPPGAAKTDAARRVAPAAATRTRADGSPAGPSVAFFDLDHTIIDTNSSWHWVQHEMNNGRVGVSMLATALYWFGRYALGFGAGAEKAGAEAAELYAGTKATDLKAEVDAFFTREMAHRQRPGCVEAMEAHAAAGERCLVCTTSWQHPAQAAARTFGLETGPDDVICSVMEVDEAGVLTGKIEKVAYGDGKYHVTKEWADRNGVDLRDCTFYTDSMSDVMLMEHVGRPVAVNPDARLRAHAAKRGWEIQDWGVAEDRLRKPRYAYACLGFGGATAGPG
jgi:HAD superfamily hydrolase (TIGR01490 family)